MFSSTFFSSSTGSNQHNSENACCGGSVVPSYSSKMYPLSKACSSSSSLSSSATLSARFLILVFALILYTMPSELPISTKSLFSTVYSSTSSIPSTLVSPPSRSLPLPTTFGSPAPWSFIEEQDAYFRHLDDKRAKDQDDDREGQNANFEFQRYRQYQKKKTGQSKVQDRFYEQQQERLQKQQSSKKHGNSNENPNEVAGSDCAGYFCSETGICVDQPILCPCLSNFDRKVLTGDWYICLRGPSSHHGR